MADQDNNNNNSKNGLVCEFDFSHEEMMSSDIPQDVVDSVLSAAKSGTIIFASEDEPALSYEEAQLMLASVNQANQMCVETYKKTSVFEHDTDFHSIWNQIKSMKEPRRGQVLDGLNKTGQLMRDTPEDFRIIEKMYRPAQVHSGRVVTDYSVGDSIYSKMKPANGIAIWVTEEGEELSEMIGKTGLAAMPEKLVFVERMKKLYPEKFEGIKATNIYHEAAAQLMQMADLKIWSSRGERVLEYEFTVNDDRLKNDRELCRHIEGKRAVPLRLQPVAVNTTIAIIHIETVPPKELGFVERINKVFTTLPPAKLTEIRKCEYIMEDIFSGFFCEDDHLTPGFFTIPEEAKQGKSQADVNKMMQDKASSMVRAEFSTCATTLAQQVGNKKIRQTNNAKDVFNKDLVSYAFGPTINYAIQMSLCGLKVDGGVTIVKPRSLGDFVGLSMCGTASELVVCDSADREKMWNSRVGIQGLAKKHGFEAMGVGEFVANGESAKKNHIYIDCGAHMEKNHYVPSVENDRQFGIKVDWLTSTDAGHVNVAIIRHMLWTGTIGTIYKRLAQLEQVYGVKIVTPSVLHEPEMWIVLVRGGKSPHRFGPLVNYANEIYRVRMMESLRMLYWNYGRRDYMKFATMRSDRFRKICLSGRFKNYFVANRDMLTVIGDAKVEVADVDKQIDMDLDLTSVVKIRN